VFKNSHVSLLLVLAVTVGAALLGCSPQEEPLTQFSVLVFTSPSCTSCKAVTSIVYRIRRKGWDVTVVNIDDNPTLAREYGVREIPAFVVLYDGSFVTRVTKEEIINVLDKIREEYGERRH
jgi:thioredoxin-like negative regulator of GroEL